MFATGVDFALNAQMRHNTIFTFIFLALIEPIWYLGKSSSAEAGASGRTQL